MPSWLKLVLMRPKSRFGSMRVIGLTLRVAGSTSMKKVPRLANCKSVGDVSGWLKALFRSAPTSSFIVSVILKNLRTPRLVPQVPGPVRELRLATLGLSRASAPTVGGAKAAALKKRSPWQLRVGAGDQDGAERGAVE